MKRVASILLLAILVHGGGTSARGAGLVLNEFNAVEEREYLRDLSSDSYFGRIPGNGKDWLELVVVDDHLDIRGWELRWYHEDDDANGTAIWDDTRVSPGKDGQGIIRFADDVRWSSLRRGTILTISQEDSVLGFDLSTDLNFNPISNDWHLHVSTGFEARQPVPLTTTELNLGDAEPMGRFAVSHKNWELSIVNRDGELTFGPIGEAIPDWGSIEGISRTEIGKLEGPADWQRVSNSQYDDASRSTFGAANIWRDDDRERSQNFLGLRKIEGIVNGDTNGDGVVDLVDLNNVRDHFGDSGHEVFGNTNMDQVVDLVDLNNVRNHFGRLDSMRVVPEPSSLAIAVMTVAVTCTVCFRTNNPFRTG